MLRIWIRSLRGWISLCIQLHTPLQWLRLNINQNLTHNGHPVSNPNQQTMKILEKTDNVIMAVFYMVSLPYFQQVLANTQSLFYPSPYCYSTAGTCFKNTHELLNLRVLKFSLVDKIYIFQSMGKIFCVEFQWYPLKFHTKYLTHTLKGMSFIQYWIFKSS